MTEERLLEHIANGGMVEGPQEATDGYLDALTKLLVGVADSEFWGLAHYYEAIKDAPTINAYVAGVALLQDEMGHATVAHRLLRDIGVDTEYLIYHRPLSELRHPYFFDIPMSTWAEFAVATALLDRAGFHLLGDIYEGTSYAPWKRALVKVHREEDFHMRLGERWIAKLSGTEAGREQVQRAIDWMFVMGLEFFGQPDDRKKNVGQLGYHLRSKPNDKIRQGWLADAVPMIERHGFTVPAHFDATKGEYVIECPFPVDFDETEKRWRFEDGPVGWDKVLERWKRRGPGVEFCIDQVRAGYRELHGSVA